MTIIPEIIYIGLNGRIYSAVLALFDEIKCCVKINGIHTDWFEVNSCLKQSCWLSTICSNLYINGMIPFINALGKGIDINGERLSILIYAGDVILLGNDALNKWCIVNEMIVK